MGKSFSRQPQLPWRLGPHIAGDTRAPADRRFSKIITVAWLTLGIASVALALIGILVLRSERKSTAILHGPNLVSLDLQDVLSDLADAEAEQRGYLLTGRPTNLENFQRARQALAVEFQRLTALVKNPAQRQELERVRSLVQQDLDDSKSPSPAVLQQDLGPPLPKYSRIAPGSSRKLFAKVLQAQMKRMKAYSPGSHGNGERGWQGPSRLCLVPFSLRPLTC